MKHITRSVLGSLLTSCLLVGCLIPACGGSSLLTGDSETHFLNDCQGGCPGELTCACGLCTKLCDEDDSCSSLNANASCVSLEYESCKTNRRVCDVLCNQDVDCTELGEGFACERGACRSGGGSAGSGGSGGSAAQTGGSGGSAAQTGGSGGSAAQTGGSGGSATGTGGASGGSTSSASGGGSAGAGGDCCVEGTLTWTQAGNPLDPQPRYSVHDCNLFSQSYDCDGPCEPEGCLNTLPECASSPVVSPEDLNRSLAHEDVADAIARAPIVFNRERNLADAPGLVIGIDRATIEVGVDGCPAPAEDCEPVPDGIRSLIELIGTLEMQQFSLGSCRQNELCHLPAEVGSCDDTLQRYYYDPETHRCEPFTYGGCEGNQNNFMSIEECQRTCRNDPCAEGAPVEQAVECTTLASGRCFASTTDACLCACNDGAAPFANCEILDSNPEGVQCTP